MRSAGRLVAFGVVCAALAVAGCDEGSDPVATPTTDPEQAPVISPVGAANGRPESKVIDVGGGTVTAAGIRVSAPAGALTGARLTPQPITDTLNGTGQGIVISSDAGWRKPLTVDTVAGTVSARLPVQTEAKRATSSGQAGRDTPQEAGRLVLKRRVKFEGADRVPNRLVRLKVNQTRDFSACARVIVKQDVSCAAGDPPPNCLRPVPKIFPFRNEKGGYKRQWWVDDPPRGNAIVGVVALKGPIGATSQAPSRVPSPFTVTVKFTTEAVPAAEGQALDPNTDVEICDDAIQVCNCSVTLQRSDSAGNAFTVHGPVSFASNDVLRGPGGGGLGFATSGTLEATTSYADCSAVSGPVTVSGSLWKAFSATDPNRFEYGIGLNMGDLVTANAICRGATVPVQLLFAFGTSCKVPVDVTEAGTDPKHVSGHKTVRCTNGDGSLTSTWTGQWDLLAP